MTKRKRSISDSRLQELEKKFKKYKELLDKEVNALDDESSDGESSVASEDKERESEESQGETTVQDGGNNLSQQTQEVDDGKENVSVQLDEAALSCLGIDSNKKAEKFEVHPELAECWKTIIAEGIGKEEKQKLLQKYPSKGNCPLNPPILNPEILSLVTSTVKSRDKYLAENQGLIGLSLVALGQALGLVFNEERDGIDKEELMQLLADSSRYLCESFFQLTKTRKTYIYPCVNEKYKSILEGAKTDECLFGLDLSKKIKSTCAVEKLVLSIKADNKKVTSKPRKNLNWRNPSSRRASGATGNRDFRFYRGGQSSAGSADRAAAQTAVKSHPSSSKMAGQK